MSLSLCSVLCVFLDSHDVCSQIIFWLDFATRADQDDSSGRHRSFCCKPERIRTVDCARDSTGNWAILEFITTDWGCGSQYHGCEQNKVRQELARAYCQCFSRCQRAFPEGTQLCGIFFHSDYIVLIVSILFLTCPTPPSLPPPQDLFHLAQYCTNEETATSLAAECGFNVPWTLFACFSPSLFFQSVSLFLCSHRMLFLATLLCS